MDLEGIDERPASYPGYREQTRAADLIVLSKCDLVDRACEAEVRRRLEETSPGTPVVESRSGRLATQWISALGAGEPYASARSQAPHDPAFAHR
ncbi:MAG: hypothetical protein AAF525_18575, partial [Pseudomonadota bacterium]